MTRDRSGPAPLAGMRLIELAEDPRFATHAARGENQGEIEVRWSDTQDERSHNDEIYRGLLGLKDSELGELRQDGVV